MNKLSAIDLLGSHTFDQFKSSHGWKEKEDKWGMKKYITDEDETFDSFEDIGNEALNPKSEWMEDLIEVDGVRDAIHTLAKKEKNERATEIMEQYDSYFDEEEEEEEVTVVAVKKRGKKKKREKTDDTESLEEKALGGDKKAMEELKKRMREEGQAGEKAKTKTVKKKKSAVKKTTPKKSTKKKSGTSSARGAAAKPSASEKKSQPAFQMKDLYVAEMYDTSKVIDKEYFTLGDLDVSGIDFEHIAAADSAAEEE